MGNETYIDVLRVSSALSPPNFTLIGNDDFYANLVWKSWCFWVFASISARSSKKLKFFMYVFSHMQRCIRVSASSFQFLTRKSGGGRAFGNIVRCFGWPSSYEQHWPSSYEQHSIASPAIWAPSTYSGVSGYRVLGYPGTRCFTLETPWRATCRPLNHGPWTVCRI